MNKLTQLIFLLSLFTSFIYPWGEDGHKLITKNALNALPAEMKQFTPWFSSVVDKCIEPDTRKREDKTEGPKHYIDGDFYKEFKTGTFSIDRKALEKSYTAETVLKMGVLPWALEDTYTKLVQAMKDHSKKHTIQMLADIAHYVGDAHQPMHMITNYDGQLSHQKGIHMRYESNMVEQYFTKISELCYINQYPITTDIKTTIVTMLHDTHVLFPVIFYADSVATGETKGKFNEEYYTIMWNYTRNLTVERLSSAASCLEAIIYKAWAEAGKPSIEQFK
ncbi:MAG: hypothetical protein LWX56_09745 [Ignavibacteria bacterium]|nr:hypothetical protein [Ignavibacteria bacterium]